MRGTDRSDQPTRLLLVRHGKHDPRGRFLQHACTGLIAAGVAQARALAARLAAEPGLSAAVVLASNAPRAIGTAEILSEALGAPLAERTCDLCELHPGAAEGLTPEEMAERYGPSYRSVPGAEWWPDWLPRARDGLERIAQTYRGRTIVAVTHSGLIRASFVVFGGMPPEQASRIWSANTAITEWSTDAAPLPVASPAWRLERHNDAAHLGTRGLSGLRDA